MKRVAILQSNYIPWKGYFDLINMVDEFIIYDDAQYTKRDWRNRNLIKTHDGLKWLTIPVAVKHKYKQKIKDTRTSDNKWVSKHLKTIFHNYSKATNFVEMKEWVTDMLKQCEHKVFLSDINYFLLSEITNFLGVNTKITSSSDYILEGDRSGKILNLCIQAGATEYLTGSAASCYLDISSFILAGIRIEWMDYSGYKQYEQLHTPFIHGVSILDLILNEGINSSLYLKSTELKKSVPEMIR
jgi:hypothetical protein